MTCVFIHVLTTNEWRRDVCPKEGIANLSQKLLPRFRNKKTDLWLLSA